jgi:hypothetical protein
MRDAAGRGALQALLASLEPVELESDTLTVRGKAFDIALVEQRKNELHTLATRARGRTTTLHAITIDEPSQGEGMGKPGKATNPAEAAMEIPLVRQTAELFEGTVIRVLKRNDR